MRKTNEQQNQIDARSLCTSRCIFVEHYLPAAFRLTSRIETVVALK